MSTNKLDDLKEYLKSLGSVAVAFSAGVDSTFLLKVAHDVLGDKAIAVTAASASFPRHEYDEADAFCKKEGIRQFIFNSNELESEDYASNPKNRCYYCKHTLFSGLIDIARQNGIEYVAEGSNMDDLGDYRPGLEAVKELGVLSPLRKVGLTKAEIRSFSKELGLPTSDKPSFACLASRVPYGERITAGKLKMVERAENLLAELGLVQYRVRVHGNIARIEVPAGDIAKLVDDSIRSKIVSKFKEFGFSYVTLDMQGYRTGSMNEVINTSK
ncbi:uncharacterized protein SAMN04487884_12754 [Butyrivibrio fibrisolvens]|uniref:TIGR00268 family protein n=1 Tax=Butyrivibrio fibrisolvens TaxID=831 RepID=A0A1H9W6F7_BUTFI|nr:MULTISPECIES: ATP-dependent sacrificial sulfur transferase LarE [Butyrivibrio]SEQ37284.1 uncharacterized protein SAMN02910382_02815 [Butyrivibrio sp. TB]SES29530.1 uncharacterized protein SAMN04487884_12754 [Butyrivibrio fibrisolvens]